MWIGSDEAKTCPDPFVDVAILPLALVECEQGADVGVRQLAATLVEPEPEFRGVIEMKSIEERRGVETSHTVRCI